MWDAVGYFLSATELIQFVHSLIPRKWWHQDKVNAFSICLIFSSQQEKQDWVSIFLFEMSAEGISEAAEWEFLSNANDEISLTTPKEIHKLVHFKNSFSFITDHAYNLNLASIFSMFIYRSEVNFKINWQYLSRVSFNSQMDQKE